MPHLSPFIWFILAAAVISFLLLMVSRQGGQSPDDDRRIADLVNSALISKQNGKITDAEHLFRRAVTVLEESRTPHFGMLTTSIINLALCCSQAGMLDESNGLYRKLVVLWRSALSRPDPDQLRDIDCAGATFDFGLSTDDVIDLFGDLVSVKKQIFGPLHDETLQSMTVQARLLHRMGRKEEQEAIEAEIQSIKDRLAKEMG